MARPRAAFTREGAYRYDQVRVKRAVEVWLQGSDRILERVVPAFDSTLVRQRSSVEPIEYVFSRRGLEDSNDRYKKHAVELACQAARGCLEQASVEPAAVDYFISTSCTGFMIPSLDAVVAERLGMKPGMRHLPITEQGCAAGAVALSQARDHLAAHPGHEVLVVAVELPSLTFQPDDRSATNVVASALFGDGAAAVLLDGERLPGLPWIVRSASHRFEDSLEWMGFDLRDSGLHIVLSPGIPDRIREQVGPLVAGFLADSGLTLEDVDHFLLHPGGRKVLEAFEESLGLAGDALRVSRDVLREQGNLSSATVLYILKEFLDRRLGRPGEKGLMIAFGPGFSAEMLLLEWPE
ncbi:MAG: type III polyketide synthase [Planctomycetota bacterium]